MPERTYRESFKVAADQLLAAVEKLLHEGNVRRVIIKQDVAFVDDLLDRVHELIGGNLERFGER